MASDRSSQEIIVEESIFAHPDTELGCLLLARLMTGGFLIVLSLSGLFRPDHK